MNGSLQDRKVFADWVRARHGDDIYRRFVLRMDQEPSVELHVLLNQLLRDAAGTKVPKNVEQLFFCSD